MQLADRLRDTEADLKQAREAFEFKCKEVNELQAANKSLRAEIARLKRINDTREEVFNRVKRFFWKEMLALIVSSMSFDTSGVPPMLNSRPLFSIEPRLATMVGLVKGGMLTGYE